MKFKWSRYQITHLINHKKSRLASGLMTNPILGCPKKVQKRDIYLNRLKGLEGVNYLSEARRFG